MSCKSKEDTILQDTYRVGMYSRYARDDQGHDVGLYLRLSRDDNNGNMESMSIANQRQLLMYRKRGGMLRRYMSMMDGAVRTSTGRISTG